jgi:hypothetical protein
MQETAQLKAAGLLRKSSTYTIVSFRFLILKFNPLALEMEILDSSTSFM